MVTDGTRLRSAFRLVLLAAVLAWLFSSDLRAFVPAVLPIAALVGLEVEFLVRAWREQGPTSVRGPAPGQEDADLGFGELVEDELGVHFEPPPSRPPRTWRDRVPTLAAVAALVAVIAVAVHDDRLATWESLAPADQSSTQARLQREATVIAGVPVRLECTDYGFAGIRSDALGVAFPQRRLTYLRPSICRDLHDVITSRSAHGDRSAEAILVLAHEAVHLRGERREGVADCLGLQTGVALGRRLGLDGASAARLMRGRYLAALADRSLTRLEYRLPDECRNGGALDLDRSSDRFP
jgi:hypothetical protein